MRHILSSMFMLLVLTSSLMAETTPAEAVATADSSRLFRDSQGRLIERVDYVSDGLGGFRPHLRKLYTYHANSNKVAETTVQFYKGEAWLNVKKSSLQHTTTHKNPISVSASI